MIKDIVKFVLRKINIFFLKKKIFFYHVPKTGGTSINSFLNTYYGPKFTQNVTDSEYFLNIMEKKKLKKIFYGHGLYKPIPNKYKNDIIEFTILRNPIEILRSDYYFQKNFSKQYQRDIITNTIEEDKLSFENFIIKSKKYYCDNIMTRMFSDKIVYSNIFDKRGLKTVKSLSTNHDVDKNDLDKAIENLKSINVYIFENKKENEFYRTLGTKIYFLKKFLNKTIDKKELNENQIILAKSICEYDLKLYNFYYEKKLIN